MVNGRTVTREMAKEYFALAPGTTKPTLQARKQIVEFMKVEVENNSFINAVSKTLQDSESDSGRTVSTNVTAKIASEVQDNIRQNSKALLKGTYVDSKSYDASTHTVKVVVKTSLRDLDTSKQLARMMGNKCVN